MIFLSIRQNFSNLQKKNEIKVLKNIEFKEAHQETLNRTRHNEKARWIFKLIYYLNQYFNTKCSSQFIKKKC